MKFKDLQRLSEKYTYFPKFSGWIFLLIILSVSAIYNYQSILFYPPQSLHLWRQCDCLSMASNYYKDNNSFLEPSVNNLGTDGSGKTVSDFPLIYYAVGKLWQQFGQHEFIFRLINLLLFYTGLFALFKICESILMDSFFAIIITALLFTSPFLVYYANNFLMNVPAFSMALIGLYFFMKFYQTSRLKNLYLFGFFFALAGLLKVPSLIGFIALGGILVLEMIGVKFKPDRKIFPQPTRALIPFILVLLVQASWYYYAKKYNSENTAGIFLIGILPIWELDKTGINTVFEFIGEHLKWDYFRPETSIALSIMLLFTIIFFRKANIILKTLTMLTLAGALVFFVLFFQALKDHDYYLINMLIAAPLVSLTFLLLLSQHFPKIYKSLLFRIIMVAILIHSIDFARRRIEGRYNPDGWINAYYTETIKHLRTLPPYLDTIGIQQSDKVICLPDESINISLYLMKRKGWTNYNIHNDSANINDKIKMGAKYLMIYDKEIMKNPEIKPFTKNKIGQYKMIEIFKL